MPALKGRSRRIRLILTYTTSLSPLWMRKGRNWELPNTGRANSHKNTFATLHRHQVLSTISFVPPRDGTFAGSIKQLLLKGFVVTKWQCSSRSLSLDNFQWVKNPSGRSQCSADRDIGSFEDRRKIVHYPSSSFPEVHGGIWRERATQRRSACAECMAPLQPSVLSLFQHSNTDLMRMDLDLRSSACKHRLKACFCVPSL